MKKRKKKIIKFEVYKYVGIYKNYGRIIYKGHIIKMKRRQEGF